MASDSFPQFPRLPPELQTKVWESALDDATASPRMIRVSVYHRVHFSHHICIAHGGDDAVFCGDRRRCEALRPDSRGSQIAMSIVDGFFSTSDGFPEPDDQTSEDGLRRLSLACQEARRVVTLRYPEMIRVHRGFFQRHSGSDDSFWAQTRFVRCDPGRDILLMTQVPDMSNTYPDGQPDERSLRERHRYLDNVFPGDPARFAHFRRVLSAFRDVAFVYHGDRRPELSSESQDTTEYIGLDMPGSSDFNTLICFFGPHTTLSVWPQPAFYPEAEGSELVMVDDVHKLNTSGFHRRRLQNMVDEIDDLIGDNARLVEIQSKHHGQSEEYWVPTLRPLERVGCFAVESWLAEEQSTGEQSTGEQSPGEQSPGWRSAWQQSTGIRLDEDFDYEFPSELLRNRPLSPDGFTHGLGGPSTGNE